LIEGSIACAALSHISLIATVELHLALDRQQNRPPCQNMDNAFTNYALPSSRLQDDSESVLQTLPAHFLLTNW
jgi:hypothetical protein